jgi:hypothetical protein
MNLASPFSGHDGVQELVKHWDKPLPRLTAIAMIGDALQCSGGACSCDKARRHVVDTLLRVCAKVDTSMSAVSIRTSPRGIESMSSDS